MGTPLELIKYNASTGKFEVGKAALDGLRKVRLRGRQPPPPSLPRWLGLGGDGVHAGGAKTSEGAEPAGSRQARACISALSGVTRLAPLTTSPCTCAGPRARGRRRGVRQGPAGQVVHPEPAAAEVQRRRLPGKDEVGEMDCACMALACHVVVAANSHVPTARNPLPPHACPTPPPVPMDVPNRPLQVGPTHRPCTKGLWMWSSPQKVAGPDGAGAGGDYHLVLLDTEGIDAYDQVCGGKGEWRGRGEAAATPHGPCHQHCAAAPGRATARWKSLPCEHRVPACEQEGLDMPVNACMAQCATAAHAIAIAAGICNHVADPSPCHMPNLCYSLLLLLAALALHRPRSTAPRSSAWQCCCRACLCTIRCVCLGAGGDGMP